jgi:putative phage-type endonuclease
MPALTPEQIAARKLGLGSSDIASIIGLGGFATSKPWNVYVDKLGIEPSAPSTPEQKRGHDLEPLLLKWYAEETGESILPGGTIVHRSEPWAFATIDGKVVGKPALVECKAVGIGPSMQWDRYADDGIPHYVRVQAAWQMWVCDYPEQVDVAAMIGGPSSFHVFRVKRDLELEALIVPAARKFWFENVVALVPPAIDDSDACRAYLAKRYPEPTSPVIRDATGDEEVLADARWTAHLAGKSAQGTKDRCDAELLASIALDTGIQGRNGWKATHKAGKDGKARYRFAGPKGAE